MFAFLCFYIMVLMLSVAFCLFAEFSLNFLASYSLKPYVVALSDGLNFSDHYILYIISFFLCLRHAFIFIFFKGLSIYIRIDIIIIIIIIYYYKSLFFLYVPQVIKVFFIPLTYT